MQFVIKLRNGVQFISMLRQWGKLDICGHPTLQDLNEVKESTSQTSEGKQEGKASSKGPVA
jgi:hypothetical protein